MVTRYLIAAYDFGRGNLLGGLNPTHRRGTDAEFTALYADACHADHTVRALRNGADLSAATAADIKLLFAGWLIWEKNVHTIELNMVYFDAPIDLGPNLVEMFLTWAENTRLGRIQLGLAEQLAGPLKAHKPELEDWLGRLIKNHHMFQRAYHWGEADGVTEFDGEGQADWTEKVVRECCDSLRMHFERLLALLAIAEFNSFYPMEAALSPEAMADIIDYTHKNTSNSTDFARRTREHTVYPLVHPVHLVRRFLVALADTGGDARYCFTRCLAWLLSFPQNEPELMALNRLGANHYLVYLSRFKNAGATTYSKLYLPDDWKRQLLLDLMMRVRLNKSGANDTQLKAMRVMEEHGPATHAAFNDNCL